MATKKAAAPKKSSTALAARSAPKDLALIDQELANEVANIKDTIGQSSGNKIRITVPGTFELPDGADLGNEIQVVVLDYISRNNFYIEPFDKDNPSPPDCYAMGKVIHDMAPEADSPAIQSPKCGSCPQNVFGSAQNGKAKACQNRRLLACLLVDPDNPDAHNAPDAPIYTLDLSPMNIKTFDGAVAAVYRSLNGPPVKAILTVVARNNGTYSLVTFTDPVPNPDYGQHVARRAECTDMLTRRPAFAAAAAKPASGRGRAGNNRQPARAGARR
jgi:hypothetical protein